MESRRVTVFQIIVVLLLTATVLLISQLVWKRQQAEAGYTVMLMSSMPPARVLVRWQSVERPKVVVGGVEWTDATGRYRMVSGNVYVEQGVVAAAALAPAQPAAEPEQAEPEMTDGE